MPRVAARHRAAILIALGAVLGVLGLGVGSAWGEFQTALLRNAKYEITERDAFDAAGDIYHRNGAVIEKLSSTEAPVEKIS
jgi:hypothetical protein